MKIINTSKENITFEQWSERIKTFMLANPKRIVLIQSALAQDLTVQIDVELQDILSGFKSNVVYSQLVPFIKNQGNINFAIQQNEENPNDLVIVPDPIQGYKTRVIFSYEFKKDIAGTNEMLNSVDQFIPVEITGLDRIIAKIKLLVMHEITGNNVFDLAADKWIQEIN